VAEYLRKARSRKELMNLKARKPENSYKSGKQEKNFSFENLFLDFWLSN
jgi:hypothetical protein